MAFTEQTITTDVFMNKPLNLSNIAEGFYFINIVQGNKSVTVKIIKQ